MTQPRPSGREAAVERVLLLVTAHRCRDAIRETPRQDAEDRQRAEKYVSAALACEEAKSVPS